MTRRDGQLALMDIRGVDVAHWDPLRRTGPWGQPTRLSHPVRNFGDLVGPRVVSAIAERLSLPVSRTPARLLSVGSILHFASDGDIVWGSGLNPKAGAEIDSLPAIDVRAVRGPRTRALLADRFGIDAPAVYGDPGLLLGALEPHWIVDPVQRTTEFSVVPNLNELATLTTRHHVINPKWKFARVVRRIAESRIVVGTSLHGVIIAEALGVPARAVTTSEESVVKYADYYLSTGRDPETAIAGSVEEALERGGVEAPRWDPMPLLAAFPLDLWTGGDRTSAASRGRAAAFNSVASDVERIISRR